MIDIRIHKLNVNNVTEPSEYIAAIDLKENWENELQNVDGKIDIITSVRYPGGKTADIDILCLLDMKNYGICLPNGREVDIHKVALILEVKDHPVHRIRKQGLAYEVSYLGCYKNASSQSFDQVNDLQNYIKSTWSCKNAPFLYNFLWFRNISQNDLDTLCGGTQPNNDNALPCQFSLEEILQRVITIKPRAVDDYGVVNSFWKVEQYGGPDIQDIVHNFTTLRTIEDCSELTRKRLDLLSAAKAEEMIQQEELSPENLTIFKGRAGTGKTIKLLQYAVYLHNQGECGQRCLLLTYNNALVADVRRLLYLSDISTKLGERTIQIKTLHSFFLDMSYNIGCRQDRIIGDPETYYAHGGYEKDLKNLFDKVSQLSQESQNQYVRDNPQYAIDWDYVLIDEAQDWMEIERDILYKVYGPSRIVVADGVDQFMRGCQTIDWAQGISNRSVINSNQSLRQKRSLTEFVNAFARLMLSSWQVIGNKEFVGGDIDIMKGYNSTFHNAMLKQCLQDDATPYDVLFLIPPKDVNDGGGFRNFEAFQKANILLFDGTDRKNRERYSTDMKLSRVYQYDSCRGLEGWCVVCYNFDILYEYKKQQFLNWLKSGKIQIDEMASDEEKAEKLTILWLLMPLTRAIDRLVITLSDSNSLMGKKLKELAKCYPDTITWHE